MSLKLKFLLPESLTRAHLNDLAESNIARAMLELKEAQPRAANQFDGAINTNPLPEECVRTLAGNGWTGEYVVTADGVTIKEGCTVTAGHLEQIPNPEYSEEFVPDEDKWGEVTWKTRVLSPRNVPKYLHRWVSSGSTRQVELSDVLNGESEAAIQAIQQTLRENAEKNRELPRIKAVLKQHREFLRQWFLGKVEDNTHILWGKPASPDQLWGSYRWELADWGVIAPEEARLDWVEFAAQHREAVKPVDAPPSPTKAAPHQPAEIKKGAAAAPKDFRSTSGEKAENPFAALAALKRK